MGGEVSGWVGGVPQYMLVMIMITPRVYEVLD